MSGLAFVDVTLGRQPFVVAHGEGRGLGLPKYAGPDDWRAALEWARGLTSRVVFETNGITYWAGDPELRPDDLTQLSDVPTLPLDAVVQEAQRLHDSLQTAIQAIRRMERERPSRHSEGSRKPD